MSLLSKHREFPNKAFKGQVAKKNTKKQFDGVFISSTEERGWFASIRMQKHSAMVTSRKKGGYSSDNPSNLFVTVACMQLFMR